MGLRLLADGCGCSLRLLTLGLRLFAAWLRRLITTRLRLLLAAGLRLLTSGLRLLLLATGLRLGYSDICCDRAVYGRAGTTPGCATTAALGSAVG